MDRKIKKLLLSGSRIVACIVLSQLSATWLNIASGVQFGTSDAGHSYAFAMFMGVVVGALVSISDLVD